MDIITFRKTHRMSQARLAAELTAAGVPATQSLISQWESGEVTIPAERAVQIEDVTDGRILRCDLRPDLWPPNTTSEAA